MRLTLLLQLLADGAFHSGQDLGERLGISRAGVWKLLRRLDTYGVDYHAVKGRGYRIPGGLNLLDERLINGSLAEPVAAGLSYKDICLQTDSTNALALEGVRCGRHQGALYVAESQTAGRGRRGRQWVSPFARNLYFSLVWSFSGGAAALEGLSLAVGIALVRALERCGIEHARLKWPNDVLVESKKIAGILLEMSGDAAGLCQVVIGVGVNASMPDDAADDIAQPWTDVERQLGQSVDRNQLLALILNELVPVLSGFAAGGFGQYLSCWHKYDGLLDRAVSLSMPTGQVDGVVRGVNEQGALVLEVERQRRVFYAGELSVRVI